MKWNKMNTIIKLEILTLSLFLLLYCSLHAQETKKCINPNLNEIENNYLDRQAEALLSEVKKTITDIPPTYPIPRERELSLYLLDAILHDKYATHRTPVQDFYHSQIEVALQDIENTEVAHGAKVWKLYNMGFIVRTKSVTIAFDLVSGASAKVDDFTLSKDIQSRLVVQCDALFISHRHGDHNELAIAEQFLDEGKPIVAPPQVWEGESIHEKITHLKRKAHTIQQLPLKHNTLLLDVVVYPGHQMSSHENNVSLVFTPEGLSIAHMGDQINEGNFMIDYDWIDMVKDFHQVDILIPPCWTNEIYRIVEGFNPKIVIPGHENELGHTIDDRVPFWGDSEYLELTYPELKSSDYPVIIMTWGESFHFIPEKIDK